MGAQAHPRSNSRFATYQFHCLTWPGLMDPCNNRRLASKLQGDTVLNRDTMLREGTKLPLTSRSLRRRRRQRRVHGLPAGHAGHGTCHLDAQRGSHARKQHRLAVRTPLQQRNGKGGGEAVACGWRQLSVKRTWQPGRIEAQPGNTAEQVCLEEARDSQHV